MQKVLIRRPGGFGRLEIVEAEAPVAGPGSAVVQVASAGVNFADCVVRMGLYPSAKEYVGWPITPGFEFAGTVQSLGEGPNPRGIAVGDEVLGVLRFGAQATHIEVPLSQMFRLPSNVSLLQAGAIPVAALTAMYALVVQGGAKEGARVLVHSAAGGVGTLLVQLAQHLNCRVVGVVGAPHKTETVMAMGADAVIDKSCENLFEAAKRHCPEGYDIVLDANGVQTLRGSYAALRPTGRLVIYGAHTMLSRGAGRPNWLKLAWDFVRTPQFNPLRLTNENKSVLAFNLSYLFEEQQMLQDSLAQICQLYATGALSPVPLREIPFAQVQLAHRELQSGKTVGKLALVF